ncbi:MAG: PQQ-like beta-propeller repeat protein [Planctomycetota bacterium]|nr:PQQ-like beta-propeller repeat protein [Planctomycetota bacterium]
MLGARNLSWAGLALFAASAVYAGEDIGWPMRSHDARRTGRAGVAGPRKAGRVWRYTAQDGNAINMEPAAAPGGVFFGTWGLTRRHGPAPSDWDKFDGKLFGLDLSEGKERFPPLRPAATPYAYVYAGRAPGPQDAPAGAGRHLNWYNGTVEGTPLVDPRDGTLYVGRGDGKLYAIDPRRGKVTWSFTTFDPARPDDPEGGGEVVGGALLTPAGAIVFATFAAPHRPDPPKLVRHETNAVYAIDRKGKLLWRYPKQGTLEQVCSAPTALSVDGARVYAATALPDNKHACELLALDASSGKLAWKLEWMDRGVHDLAVGADGTIFCAGMRQRLVFPAPAVWAIEDAGASGKERWGPTEPDPGQEGSHWAGGLALFEDGGAVKQVFASTTSARMANSKGGRLHRLDPATGAVNASWDPKQAEPSCVGGLTDVTLDRDGVVYVGARGRLPMLGQPVVNGRMYALRVQGAAFEVLWSLEVQDQLDWASPALGPDGGLFFGSSAAIHALAHVLPHAPDEDVPNADPIFYGVHE